MKTIKNLTADEIRKSILQLAIQGKLVKQNLDDEPASELVKKIYAEKKRLIAEGKIKKDKNESFIFKGDDNCYYEKIGKNEPVKLDDLPFDIPDNWTWIRHNSIYEIFGGSQPPKSKFITMPKNGYIRLYQIRDYGPKPDPIYIPIKDAHKIAQKGDILLARYGASVGKVFFAEDGAYNVAMAKVEKLYEGNYVNRMFLYTFYKSNLYQSLVLNNSRSAQAGFNKEDLNELYLPLPPLEEQKRIVDKINSFEPLLQEYEKYEKKLTKLEEEFPDKLKKSILQYAIEGKLVKQDPNDEPASVLLERIKAEKEQLIKEGKIKRDKNESYIYQGDDKNYYEKIDDITQKIEVPFCSTKCVWTKVKNIAFITKLAGFEYSEYINPNLTTRGVPLFKGKNVQNSKVVYDFESYIPIELSEQLIRSQVSKKCLLTPYVGSIGNVGIHDKPGIYHLGSNVGKIEIYNNTSLKIMEEYVFYYLKSYTGYAELTKYKKATAQESISIDAIRETLIPIYPLNVQKKLHLKIQNINLLIDKVY